PDPPTIQCHIPTNHPQDILSLTPRPNTATTRTSHPLMASHERIISHHMPPAKATAKTNTSGTANPCPAWHNQAQQSSPVPPTGTHAPSEAITTKGYHPRLCRWIPNGRRMSEDAPPGPSSSCLGYNSTPSASAYGKNQARTTYAGVGSTRWTHRCPPRRLASSSVGIPP